MGLASRVPGSGLCGFDSRGSGFRVSSYGFLQKTLRAYGDYQTIVLRLKRFDDTYFLTLRPTDPPSGAEPTVE